MCAEATQHLKVKESPSIPDLQIFFTDDGEVEVPW